METGRNGRKWEKGGEEEAEKSVEKYPLQNEFLTCLIGIF